MEADDGGWARGIARPVPIAAWQKQGRAQQEDHHDKDQHQGAIVRGPYARSFRNAVGAPATRKLASCDPGRLSKPCAQSHPPVPPGKATQAGKLARAPLVPRGGPGSFRFKWPQPTTARREALKAQIASRADTAKAIGPSLAGWPVAASAPAHHSTADAGLRRPPSDTC